MKNSIIKEKSYTFALRIIAVAKWLREHREYELVSQLVRAGTGIGANVEEASAGVSRADFIAKMAVASKEARETHYWLRLLRDSKIVPNAQDHPADGSLSRTRPHPHGHRENVTKQVNNNS